MGEDAKESDAWTFEIVIEEWKCLTTHSWLFAKTDAIYDRMIDAGADAMYVTKEKPEQAIEYVTNGVKDVGHAIVRGFERVGRRTLKKRSDHEVSRNDCVRTMAK